MAKTRTSFKKGQGGRKHGSQNKLTKTVKEAFESAFNALQDDPRANLLTWGRANPGYFYPLAAKLIPTELKGTIEQNTVTINIVKKKKDE